MPLAIDQRKRTWQGREPLIGFMPKEKLQPQYMDMLDKSKYNKEHLNTEIENNEKINTNLFDIKGFLDMILKSVVLFP